MPKQSRNPPKMTRRIGSAFAEAVALWAVCLGLFLLHQALGRASKPLPAAAATR